MPDHRAKNNRRNAAGGLHSIATLQTLANGAKPCERQHMATRFARLENERTRLERELMIWEERSRATATKLVKVGAGIAALRPALLEAPGGMAVASSRGGPSLRRLQRETNSMPGEE
jgi:hypothetical protein